MIHIACCSNEKLAPMFGVVIASVGINTKSDMVMMYLLHNGLKDRTINRLKKIIYTLIPNMKTICWENKTFIEGWERLYKNREL